jgi:succinoglycan biosynthesis transport protein ExoP
METEEVSQVLSISKRGRQLQQLPAIEKDEVSTPPQKGLNFRPIMRAVKRKVLLIIGLTVVCGGGAFHHTKDIKPAYEGDFRLLVEPITTEAKISDPSALTRSEGRVPSQDFFGLDYATQLEILQSPKMLASILETVRSKYPDIKEFPFKKSLVVQRYTGGKPASPEAPQTKIIQVLYTAEDPKQVLFVLDVVAKKFLDYSLQERKSRIGEGVKFIDEQLPTLQTRVNTLQSQLQGLQQQYKLTDPKTHGDALLSQVRDISTQQAAVERELRELITLKTNLQRQLELTPTEAIKATDLNEDPNRKVIQTQIQEIDTQIAKESARFNDESPTMKALYAKKANLIELQKQGEERILGASQASAANNKQVTAFQSSVRIGLSQELVKTTNQIELLEVRNQSISRLKESLEREAQQLPTISRQYTELQGELAIAQKTRDQLLTQRETLKVEEAQKQVPWELISKPQIPKDPNGKEVPAPDKLKTNIKLLGILGGLILGVLLAVIIEKLRDIFYNAKEIEEDIDLRLLGAIPTYKSNKPLQTISASTASSSIVQFNEETKVRNKNSSAFQEAFESLYANIRFLFNEPRLRSLTVCSAASGDGKSTIAIHLAQTAAAMGQRVLLVDANFRQPNLHERLNLQNQKGLSNLLAKKLDFNDFIQPSLETNNLFVLTSGQLYSNSTKLLASDQMQSLMEQVQATFDLVIYDTPNLIDFMDASFLATHTDGILMVIAVGKTKRSIVTKSLKQLNTFRLPTLGTIANHVKKGVSIPYAQSIPIKTKIENEEEPQVLQPAGKWLNFQQNRLNNRKSS